MVKYFEKICQSPLSTERDRDGPAKSSDDSQKNVNSMEGVGMEINFIQNHHDL